MASHASSDFNYESSSEVDSEVLREDFGDLVDRVIELGEEINPVYRPFFPDDKLRQSIVDGAVRFSIIDDKFSQFAELSQDDWTKEHQDALEEIRDMQLSINSLMSDEDIEEIINQAIDIVHSCGIETRGTSPVKVLGQEVKPTEHERIHENYGIFRRVEKEGSFTSNDIHMAGGVEKTLGMYALSVAKMAEMVGRKRTEMDYPERITNDYLSGLDDARYQLLEEEYALYDLIDYNGDIDGALNQYAFEGEGEYNRTMVDNHFDIYFRTGREIILEKLKYNQQLYLATAFVDNELRRAFDKAGIEGRIEVGRMDNTREQGLTYTVMQPDGNTRTFTIYEHRNYDTMIINGKQNFDPDSHYFPYAGNSKNDYFAEIPYGDYQQAADQLAFFISSAQRGELPNDEWLEENASRVDKMEMFMQMPGFAQFMKKRYPEYKYKPSSEKTEDEILGDLDFNIDDDDYR